jgi:CO/xanthine dehydrogenase Mo-binding subunit
VTATQPATGRTGSGAPPVRDHSAKRTWVGQSIRRVEDPKFLLGRGGYIADRITPGTLHAAVLRSTHAHARIVRIETAEALAAPGVHAVITGAEAAQLCDPMPDFGPDPAKHTWRCLAAEKVRYVGEGVAVVVADSRYLAEDALELIEVEYEPLPAVTDPERALDAGSPLVHEALESNCAYERSFDFGDVDRDFAEADVVVRDRLRWHRSGGQPLETVGAIAEYDLGTGSFTIDTNTLSFTSYLFMAAGTLKVPVNKLDIRPVPAGGSFGSKLFANKPAVIAGMCARKTGRRVAYLEDRSDNIANCDHHGSDRVYDVELAMMRDGTMRGIKIDVIDDYGAYIQFGVGHHGNALAQVVGPYTIGSVRYRVRAALTNKNQQGAYRGFGSEVNNWMLEQIVDKAARELGLDPVAVRRMNFIRDFPYFIPTGNVYDSGDYERVLDHALDLADYGRWRDEQRRLREQEGRYIGIGVITAQERSVFSATEFWFWFDEPGAPVTSTPESVSLKVDATGGITAILYSCAFWGNSPETMVAQLVAEEFDCSPYDVSIAYHGSRDGLPATGPGGSRTTVMLAGAVEGASVKIKEKARRAAAHLLEIGPDDLEWADGGFRVRGDPERKKTLGEIAIMLHLFKHSFPEDMESGLDASKVFDHPYTTMPSADRKDLGVFYPFMGHACHVPVVEVDIETGAVTFLHYAAVHDCGTLVNPRSLAGHIVGGTAQGIGTALYEEFVYDEDGQLLSSSFMDYLIPTAMEVPELTIGHVETPSPYTPHGIKGGGEGGRMMAPAAINAAVNDALAPLGVRLTELPMTPERILTALRAAGHAG